MHNKATAYKKMTGSVFLVILLLAALIITTAAIAVSVLEVRGNTFTTGRVSINLNDGKAVFGDEDLLIEPGMVIRKEFFLQNNSSCEVYYRLFIEQIDGELSDILEVTLTEGDTVVFNGIMSDFRKENIADAFGEMQIGEKKQFAIQVSYPETAVQLPDSVVSFNVCADAVQKANNPQAQFE